MADLTLNSETELSELKQQLAQREAELQIINGVQQALAANLDMQAIYDLVGDNIRDVFDAQGVQLVRFDHKNNIMHRHYVVEKGQRFYIDPVSIDKLWAALIHRGGTWLVDDLQTLIQEIDPNFMPPVGEIPKSALFVPLINQGEMYGVITLFNMDRKNAFEEANARLLETIAGSMSLALENARLFAETQRLLKETEQRVAELAIINSVQEGLSSKLDIQAIYELIGEKVREIFNVQVADIVIYDPATNLISMPYSYEKGDRSVITPQKPYGFRLDVINNRVPILINRNFTELASKYSNPLITGEWPKSAVFVPLLVDDKAKGILSIQDMDREDAYKDSDVRLLQTLANAMSIALENARLFDETQRLFHAEQQRVAELQIINSVQQGLATRLDVQAIFDLVGDRIRDIFQVQVVMISTYDRQTKTIEHRYAIERGERIYAPGHHPIKGFRIWVVETRQPVLVSTNVAELAAQLGQPTLPGTITPKTWLGVPLIVEDQVTGILSLQDVEHENAFGEPVVRLLQTLANAMSVALENARLFDETQQRNAELAIINRVQDGLAAKLDMRGIYDLVGDKIRDIFNAQAVVISSYDHATETIQFNYFLAKGIRTYADPIAFTEMTRHLIRARHFVLINEDMERRAVEFRIQPIPGTSLGKSGLWMPLIVGDEVRGVINLHNLDYEGAFSDSDIRLLETLANSMSVALENARLWEQENLYRKALEREFEIGREIQADFLPKSLPQPEGWEIAASLKSAREVAGDFYDVFYLSEDKIGLVIADVCDKGLGAALFMTLFRSLLRAVSNIDFYARVESSSNNSPAARLKNAILLTNNYIAETHGQTGMFATVFFGILDIHTGILTYINGGHLPPLLLDKNGVKKTLDLTGPAVGAVLDANYIIREMEMNRGDLLFAYTDGLTDTENRAGELFSEKKLLPLLLEEQSLDLLLTQIQKRIEDHAAGANQFDDITMLILRRM